jgi:phospholipid/cholesterol/gamma-HCH transport system substrate-binding protein
LVNLDRLVNSVPKSALRDLISQLGAAFNNTGPSLATLLDQTKALLSTATSDVPQTTRLIGDSSTVLATQIALSNDILSFSRHLASLSGQLRTADGAVRRIITEGVPTATEVSQLVNSVDATLPVVVSNLITVGQMAAVRIPGLREILIIYPYVVATSFGLFPGGGTRFGVPLPTPQNSNPQPCLTGYLPPSQWRLPSDLRYPPIRWHSFCTAPVASNTGPRGSREGPDPSGGRLGNDPSYQHSDGVPHANATQPGTPGSSYTGSAGTSYDLASTGGQQWMMMGEPSWSYLLLAPLVW